MLFFRGCSYGGELARLGRLADLGEMIFIPRSYGISYLSSVRKFMLLEKNWSSSFYNKQWRKAIMHNKCSHIIWLTSEKQSKTD